MNEILINTLKYLEINEESAIKILPYSPNLIITYSKTLQNVDSFIHLTILDVSGLNLTYLPSIMSLTTLYCNSNKLTQLPEYPLLTILHCNHNQLTQLPEYPLLTRLNCNVIL